jgi:hypothetical protein
MTLPVEWLLVLVAAAIFVKNDFGDGSSDGGNEKNEHGYSPVIKELAVTRAFMLSNDGGDGDECRNEEWHGIAPWCWVI